MLGETTDRSKESSKQDLQKQNESRRHVYVLQRESWREEFNHVKYFGRDSRHQEVGYVWKGK